MSMRAPERAEAPAKVPPAGAPLKAPGRPARTWIVVIVALVVGGLVGYLIGWNLAPADTETVTVTDTVTETVAAPAYTAGTEMEALVTFDGTNCMYAGPAEVNARTRMTFTYLATVKNSGAIVWKVAPGTTYEQVVEATETRGADDPPPFLDYYETSEPLDTRQQTLSMSMVEGTYVVSCVTSPETTNDVFASTMVRVTPG